MTVKYDTLSDLEKDYLVTCMSQMMDRNRMWFDEDAETGEITEQLLLLVIAGIKRDNRRRKNPEEKTVAVFYVPTDAFEQIQAWKNGKLKKENKFQSYYQGPVRYVEFGGDEPFMVCELTGLNPGEYLWDLFFNQSKMTVVQNDNRFGFATTEEYLNAIAHVSDTKEWEENKLKLRPEGIVGFCF